MFLTLFGVVILLLLSVGFYRWKKNKNLQPPGAVVMCTPVQLVHRLCPHHNVVQSYEVQQKDSLDEHLDLLTRKLAEKEGRLRLSKSKVRETQNEIDNLHAIDADVQQKYLDILDSLRNDLFTNEKDCRRLQEQIEWVSRRRAELNNEIQQGQQLYSQAATELASNLTELQRGRALEHSVFDKPHAKTSGCSTRVRKEPHLLATSPFSSIIIKSSPPFSRHSLTAMAKDD